MYTQNGTFKIIGYLALALLLSTLNACATKPKPKPIPVVVALTNDSELHHAFIEKMVNQHQFDRSELTAILEKSELQSRILDAMMNPAEHRLEWYQYRKIFLKKARIDGGVEFWKKNKQLLEQASKKYGVPAEIIVAIIGVETRYGDNVGHHRVLDALVTLGFHFPRRASFFQSELEHFLLLCREEGFNPLEPQGSYAGAMGQSQFIASSYRAYAVDGDDDNKRDLWDSPADIIHSVAHYFSKHGWTAGQPIAQVTHVKGEGYKKVITGRLKPQHTLQNLANNQVMTPTNLPAKTRVKLLELKQVDSLEYWLAFHNFYVITRYNHSQLYAMAAYQLSVEIKKKMEQR